MSAHRLSALASWATNRAPEPPPPRTTTLSAALRDLATTPDDDPVLVAGVRASACTLTAGLTQDTRATRDLETLRKHGARLRAALGAMAGVLEREEVGRG